MSGAWPVLAVLGWLFTALLLVLVVASVAASRGAIPANHLFGVRLPVMMRSAAAWRAGHAAAVLPAACAFAVALTSSSIAIALPGASVVAIAAFVVGVVSVFVRASRAGAAALRVSGPSPRRG
ncbi:MAG: hypothetical protein HIU86_05105 [Acidobacteria bacterium]|nr:hypothetical protein [Acidobacteriota bacterium]